MEKFVVKSKSKLSQGELLNKLAGFGYERLDGDLRDAQFAKLGGVIKIFPVFADTAYEIDFFGSEIERIITKRDGKIEQLECLEIRPNRIILEGGVVTKPGDYLVHEDYGIGLFSHLTKKEFGKEEFEYLVLNYLHGDVLFVPLEQIGRLSPYIGVGRKRPKLSKLGTETWKKTYKRVYDDVIKMARHLLDLYAEREIVRKTPRRIYKEWEAELVKTFGFEETPDQQSALNEMYGDLTKNTPMDRLICGDVGFGKTEVALRAAAQTVANGYQVIFLVPTTILCEQHFSTLKKRFKNLPVTLGRLSRFVALDEQKTTLDKFKDGSIDILVSTHKVLKGSFESKNLGLLVVDEEQKFGVKV